MQVRIDRPATPPLQGLATRTLDPAGLARNRGSRILTNCCQAVIILCHILLVAARTLTFASPPFLSPLAWQFAQTLSTLYSSVWRIPGIQYVELFPHSHHLSSPIQQQLTNPAAAPSLVQPGPSAATKALDGQLEPPPHPHPPPRQPLPSPGSRTTDEFVAARACGGTSNSHRPGPSCQHQGQTHSTIEPLASLSAPESTGVEGIQVGRIASQHPFAGRWALACVSD